MKLWGFAGLSLAPAGHPHRELSRGLCWRLFVFSLLLLAPALHGGMAQAIDGGAAQQESLNPFITPAQLHAYFVNYYNNLLANPAVSGLTIQVGRARINPNSPATSSQPYDWISAIPVTVSAIAPSPAAKRVVEDR
jgi:hypothetical protein